MMQHSRLVLAFLAGVLLMLLASEWLLPDSAGAGWQPHPSIPTAMADISSDADINAWTSTILARPLLSPSRRPAPPAGEATTDTLPRLSAIIVTGGTRHAIFAATGQTPQMVSQGGEIGVYRIESVAPDKVDLTGPNGPVTLRPQFIAKAAETPPQ